MGVLFSLATYADMNGKECRPGYRRLRRGTGAVNDTIKAALGKGTIANVIRLEEPRRAGRADVYSLVHPEQWKLGTSDARNGKPVSNLRNAAEEAPDIRHAGTSDLRNAPAPDLRNVGASDIRSVTTQGTSQTTSHGTTQVRVQPETERHPNKEPNLNRTPCGCGRDCYGWGYRQCRENRMTENEWKTHKGRYIKR
jgi:hypothetical protein